MLKRDEHRSVLVSSGQVECVINCVGSVTVFIMETTSLSFQTRHSVNRRNKDGTRKQICPQSVKVYNNNMGGLDSADARLKAYEKHTCAAEDPKSAGIVFSTSSLNA